MIDEIGKFLSLKEVYLMIKLRDGSAIVIEPKGAGLNIVLKSKNVVANKDATTNKDGNRQEQAFTFTLPMSMLPLFYGSLFGKNYFSTKNNQQYILVVMHAGVQRKQQQSKTSATSSINTTTNTTQSTQPSSVASMLPGAEETPPTQPATLTTQPNAQASAQAEKKQDQIRDLELVNLLVYEKQESGKRSPKYIAKFTISRVNILRLKQEVKKALKQIDKWSLRTKSITLTKAGSVIIITQNANQLILDYTNKEELKDDLTEFVMSNREEYTISKIKFTKDDAITLLSLLTHMEI